MSGSSPSSSRRPRGRRRPASRGKASQPPAPARHEAQDIPYVPEVFTPDPIPFSQLGLDPRLLDGIRDLGWTETRPVQSGVVPLALFGVDVIACAETGYALAAERAFLDCLDGSCRTPIAGYARITQGRLHFSGLLLSPDGQKTAAHQTEGPFQEAAQLGQAAGETIRAAAPELIPTPASAPR